MPWDTTIGAVVSSHVEQLQKARDSSSSRYCERKRCKILLIRLEWLFTYWKGILLDVMGAVRLFLGHDLLYAGLSCALTLRLW